MKASLLKNAKWISVFIVTISYYKKQDSVIYKDLTERKVTNDRAAKITITKFVFLLFCSKSHKLVQQLLSGILHLSQL